MAGCRRTAVSQRYLVLQTGGNIPCGYKKISAKGRIIMPEISNILLLMLVFCLPIIIKGTN